MLMKGWHLLLHLASSYLLLHPSPSSFLLLLAHSDFLLIQLAPSCSFLLHIHPYLLLLPIQPLTPSPISQAVYEMADFRFSPDGICISWSQFLYSVNGYQVKSFTVKLYSINRNGKTNPLLTSYSTIPCLSSWIRAVTCFQNLENFRKRHKKFNRISALFLISFKKNPKCFQMPPIGQKKSY